MSPEHYLRRLEEHAATYGLSPCDLRPEPMANVEAVVSLMRGIGPNTIKANDLASARYRPLLPKGYANWLLTVGTGTEFGGFASWHHWDVSRPGNVWTQSTKLTREAHAAEVRAGRRQGYQQFPRTVRRGATEAALTFLAVLTTSDGLDYGYLVSELGLSAEPCLHCWDRDRLTLKCVDGFGGALGRANVRDPFGALLDELASGWGRPRRVRCANGAAGTRDFERRLAAA